MTSVYIVNSNIRSKTVNNEFFASLGFCSQPIKQITFRNNSLHNLTIGGGLETLRTLDLRYNDVDIINKPESDTIEELFLSGLDKNSHFSSLCSSFYLLMFLENYWPCVDYSKLRSSSLEFGRSMTWLLEPSWSHKWRDVNTTFCSSFYRNTRTLQYFLKFTQVNKQTILKLTSE